MSSKQYMPFDALKGLRSELKKQQEIKVEKPVLDEEVLEHLSYQLSHYKKRDYIELDYYHNEKIIHLEGTITYLDCVSQYLKINEVKINFIDILKIYE